MNQTVMTIDVGNMHPLQAEKTMRYFIEHREYKEFPAPTKKEKIIYCLKNNPELVMIFLYPLVLILTIIGIMLQKP